mmetsp:Transcript_8838/g.12828  ORF Transcript_8838/g.12828 Transcript_8838/m.12828 type:complete len:235 (-) Transcript_8838:749-1453(-)
MRIVILTMLNQLEEIRGLCTQLQTGLMVRWTMCMLNALRTAQIWLLCLWIQEAAVLLGLVTLLQIKPICIQLRRGILPQAFTHSGMRLATIRGRIMTEGLKTRAAPPSTIGDIVIQLEPTVPSLLIPVMVAHVLVTHKQVVAVCRCFPIIMVICTTVVRWVTQLMIMQELSTRADKQLLNLKLLSLHARSMLTATTMTCALRTYAVQFVSLIQLIATITTPVPQMYAMAIMEAV